MPKLFLFCFIFAEACYACRLEDDVAEAFVNHELAKDLGIASPELEISIAYDSGAIVTLGNTLTPRQVRNPPVAVSIPAADPRSLYTLCLTDPDAPSRAEPSVREWHHWLAVNVPGGDLVRNKVKGQEAIRDLGDTMTEYVGSGPPKGTGLHRYTFLAFRQPNRICPDEAKLPRWSAEGRANFSIANFAEKYEWATRLLAIFTKQNGTIMCLKSTNN